MPTIFLLSSWQIRENDNEIKIEIKSNKLQWKINNDQTKKNNQILRWYLNLESPRMSQAIKFHLSIES